MNRQTTTFEVDILRFWNDEWDMKFFRDGEEILHDKVHVDEIELPEGLTASFDEYYTEFSGETMEVTVSYIHRESEEWGEYDEDHRLESVDLLV